MYTLAANLNWYIYLLNFTQVSLKSVNKKNNTKLCVCTFSAYTKCKQITTNDTICVWVKNGKELRKLTHQWMMTNTKTKHIWQFRQLNVFIRKNKQTKKMSFCSSSSIGEYVFLVLFHNFFYIWQPNLTVYNYKWL